MGWGRKGREEAIINDPMNVLIMGESYNYPAHITVDRDGAHLHEAIELMHEMGATGLEAVLGSDQDIENVLEAARASDPDES